MRDWQMRTKLGAVFVIPTVAFLVLAGIQTTSLVEQATSLNEFASQLRAGQQITTLIHDLQRERDRTAGEMAAVAGRPGSGADRARIEASLEPAYRLTDRSVAEFRRVAAPLVNSGNAWQHAYERADEVLNQLPAIRSAVPGGSVLPSTIATAYTRRIETLLLLLAEPTPGNQRPDLTDAVQRHAQLARAKESVSQLRGQLYAVARGGRPYSAADREDLNALRSRQLTALAAFRARATRDQMVRFEEAAGGTAFQSATTLEDTSLLGPATLPNASNWWSISEQRHDLLRGLENSVLDDAVRLADVGSGAQARRALAIALLLLAVLLLAIVISVVIGRSVAKSLRMLRAQALQVAQLELPEALNRLRVIGPRAPDIEVSPPVVRSMDEIGEVAEAFTAVHRSAVAVAIEQAIMRRNVNAMFVNLARRSQVLVERQLELLDELEREEGDPDQLDSLFKLDHLAARMRRNDESLLILAGTESSRRWSQPAPLPTVMLAAVAEIEHYQRVRHDVGDQIYVVGHAIADLVHLLAELLENATAFSPPEMVVTMTGRHAAGETALIEIADEGLGMSPAALDDANELLAAPPAADVAASERMGLFVVSHLAARLGVRVQLQAVERGVVAAVWLPEAILAPPSPQELGQPSVRPMLAATAAATASTASPAGPGPSTNGTRSAPYLTDLPVAGRRPEPVAPQPMPVSPAPASPRPAPVVSARVAPEPISPTDTLPPLPPVVPAPRRAMPTRAENVLSGSTRSRSVWWTRQPGAASAPTSLADAAPPATPVTGGMSASGLPLRVPMAQLPKGTEATPPPVPAPRPELDPEATGGMLTRFYGAVRRAETEDTETVTAPIGARRGREQR
ncbi:MAG TPA: ATP-binding protein [Micromonosporaceae bacterium]|nr:ATP-binding protein [Micromonosporaceae bacterium]